MGWNIFYKECKLLAAHRMLRILNHTRYADFKDLQGNFHVGSPRFITINNVYKKMKMFGKHIVIDSVTLLDESSSDKFLKEIDYLHNSVILEAQIKLMKPGEIALKERKYIRLFLKSAKIIVPLLIAIAASLIPYLLMILKLLHLK